MLLKINQFERENRKMKNTSWIIKYSYAIVIFNIRKYLYTFIFVGMILLIWFLITTLKRSEPAT